MTKTLLIFFGNEKLATGLPPAKPIIRDAAVAAGFELEQVVTGSLGELTDHKAQLAVLAAYGRIIPQSVLDQFSLGIINIHPSLLPQYRGPTPIEQAILDGATKTGVSIMRLTAGMDEGPIYKQKTLHLKGSESKVELAQKLQLLGAELLTEVLSDIANGKLKPRNQPHPNRATYCKLLNKENGHIDWTESAEQIERKIRAYLGWPGSYARLEGKNAIITQAHVEKIEGIAGKTLVKNNNLIVYCGSEALVIDKIKPTGKNEMSGTEFIRGYIR